MSSSIPTSYGSTKRNDGSALFILLDAVVQPLAMSRAALIFRAIPMVTYLHLHFKYWLVFSQFQNEERKAIKRLIIGYLFETNKYKRLKLHVGVCCRVHKTYQPASEPNWLN